MSGVTPSKRNSALLSAWLTENFTECEGSSILRTALYDAYEQHCRANGDDMVVAAALFGKVIRSVFPRIKTRRLGTRGNSKYHYYGIKVAKDSPLSIETVDTVIKIEDRDSDDESSTETNGTAHNSRLPPFDLPATAAVELAELGNIDPHLNVASVTAFLVGYRAHCLRLLDQIFGGSVVEMDVTLSSYWRAQWDRRNMFTNATVIRLVTERDVQVYHTLATQLLPNVLHPLPIAVATMLKDYTRKLVNWLDAALAGFPETFRQRKLDVARQACATLFKQASLNHLAQAARAVLANPQHLTAMLRDLAEIDLPSLQAQAGLVCSCPDDVVFHTLCDIHYNIENAYSLEQWTQWLHSLVGTFVTRANLPLIEFFPNFFLKWSLYGSLLVRHLTVKNAVSFGSFHLLRTLFDDYLLYMLEQEKAYVPHAADGATHAVGVGEHTPSRRSARPRRASRKAADHGDDADDDDADDADDGGAHGNNAAASRETEDAGAAVAARRFKPIPAFSSADTAASASTGAAVRAGTPKSTADHAVANSALTQPAFGMASMVPGPSPAFGPSPSPTPFRSVFAPSPAFGMFANEHRALAPSPSLSGRISAFQPSRDRDVASPLSFSPFGELFNNNADADDVRNVARTLAARRGTSPATILHPTASSASVATLLPSVKAEPVDGAATVRILPDKLPLEPPVTFAVPSLKHTLERPEPVHAKRVRLASPPPAGE